MRKRSSEELLSSCRMYSVVQGCSILRFIHTLCRKLEQLRTHCCTSWQISGITLLLWRIATTRKSDHMARLLLGAAMPRVLCRAKSLIVPAGRTARMIRSGAFSGLRMNLDLTCQTQMYLGLFEAELHKWLSTLAKNVKTS